MLDGVRDGQSAVLVIRGDEGIGKTAQMQFCAYQAFGWRERAVAVTAACAEWRSP